MRLLEYGAQRKPIPREGENFFCVFIFFFFLLLLENSNVLSPNNNSENGGIKIESALLCFVVVAFHRSVLVAAALVFEWV